jgi:YVTN family beta-propeller protein
MAKHCIRVWGRAAATLLAPLLIAAAGLTACNYKADPANGVDGGVPGGPGGGGGGGGDTPGQPGATVALKHPSRSSTIALTDDGFLVVMVNPDDNSISIFKTSDNSRVAKLTTGGEPSSVVAAPDNQTVYVANRADATVVKVTGIDTLKPQVSGMVSVGSEPAGLALSPTGAKLFVAEFAQGRVSVIDTGSMSVTGTIEAPVHPRALAVTNNGDLDDNDERLLVPEFFGEPVAGKEAKDDGRGGRIRMYHVSDLTPDMPILLASLDSGFAKGGAGTTNVTTSPNQLTSISILDTRVFVTSVSASPEGPPRFDNNVFPVVYVADLSTHMEVRTAAGTTNLARKVFDAVPAPSATSPRFALGDLSDMAFVPGKNIAYAVSRAADAVQRVVWGADGVQVGSTQNTQIDVLGNTTIGNCQAPTGVVATEDATKLYVNCWVSRRLGIIDLKGQALQTTVEASPAPDNAADQSRQRGKRFFFTGRGRWSNAGSNGAKGGEGWSSCGSCHPDGQTDNVTWSFAAGPRQTISMVGSFSHGSGTQKQRIFNHSGIFDEMHDFEANTRGVSGGLGAITNATDLTQCNSLTGETAVAPLPGGLAAPAKELADNSACKHKDWDDIDNFVRALRPPRAIVADAAAVAHGRTLFEQGGCAKCHGGAGWTVSRRFYTPSTAVNTALATDATQSLFAPPSIFPATWSYQTKQIATQPIIGADATGPAEAAVVAPAQAACVLRNVGTFGDGVGGNAGTTDALERKPDGTRAQGRGGYNIPSLYGLALRGPYLHHGQAPTLEVLFTDSRWAFHTGAGAANFLAGAKPGDADVQDLKAFLLSIDASQPEVAIPTQNGISFDACPAGP